MFEAERPLILGAFLTPCRGSERLPHPLASLPRMAISRSGRPPVNRRFGHADTFWSAYCGTRDDKTVDGVIDADPIAAAVRAMMQARTERTVWTGNATDLLGNLSRGCGRADCEVRSHGPKARERCRGGCAEQRPSWRQQLQSHISFEREGRARTRTIAITPTQLPETGPATVRTPASSAYPSGSPNPTNGSAAAPPRTAANDADGTANGAAPNRPRQPLEIQWRDTQRTVRTQISQPNLRREKLGVGLEGKAMSAAEALKAARAAGIQLGIDGDDLVLEAAVPPPPAVIDLLSSHKASIVALLRPAEDGWSAEDRQVLFDERAAIIEFDGGASRTWAEALARLDPASPPGDIPPKRWLQFIDDCGMFLDDGWAGPCRRGWAGSRSTCSAATAPSLLPASTALVCSGYSTAGSFSP